MRKGDRCCHWYWFLQFGYSRIYRFCQTSSFTCEITIWLFKDLSRIDQTLSLTIWLGLKEKWRNFDYTGSEVWFRAELTGNANQQLWCEHCSRGKQLVGFTFVIEDNKNIEREKKKALELIMRAIPGIEGKIEMTHYQVTIPEKAAVTIKGYFCRDSLSGQGSLSSRDWYG